MRNILTEFGYPLSYSSTLFLDNKSGIDVSKNPEHHGRMKHLDLRLYWLRDAVQESLISPVYVPTRQNIADLFTKAVQPQVIQFAVPKLGLITLLLDFLHFVCFLDLSDQGGVSDVL